MDGREEEAEKLYQRVREKNREIRDRGIGEKEGNRTIRMEANEEIR